MTSCSQAPRGLFVLLRVRRIFTALAISPSPQLRQCPDRSTFRAGRNLPDKEFRYLRTVIVTAAVYWGFGSALARLPLTFQHWAGVSPYTSTVSCSHGPVFMVNSRLGLVTATPRPLHTLGATRQGVPLLPKLRGHFAEFLNWGSLVHLGLLDLSTCVGVRYGYTMSSTPRPFVPAQVSRTCPTRRWRSYLLLGQRPLGFASAVSLPA